MIRPALLILAAALTAAPSVPVPFGPGTENYDGWPPVRYEGDASVMVSFQSHVGSDCGPPAPEGLVTLACEFDAAKGVPVMVLPNPCAFAGEEFAKLACHELAHRNFWPANHPN